MVGAMDGPLVALLVIAAGLVVGWLLFSVAGEASMTANSFFGVLGRAGWIIVGIAAIIGGYLLAGFFLIAVGLFLGLGHWEILKDSDIRATIAGD